MAVLELINGLNPGQQFPLEGQEAVLGRHPECDIWLDVGAVSRRHCKVTNVGGDYFVEDLGSRNGTSVNGDEISGRHLLHDQDRVRICDLEFTFHIGPVPVPPQEDPPSSMFDSHALMVDDSHEEQATSTIVSKIDVSVGESGLRLAVKPEAKLKAMFEIMRNIRRALNLDDVLLRILDSLFKIFVQADRGFVVLASGDRLVPKAVRYRRDANEDTVRISRTIVNHVMQSKEAILSADAVSDQRFNMAQSIADFRIRSMMCAPLLDSEGTALGVIQIDALESHGRFGQDDLDVLAAVADQASIAVENAQLHEQALRRQSIERDLELAREVQLGLLPDTRPQVPGFSFFDYYSAANEVGGDYFDYLPLPDGRMAVVLADVAGKGVAAALLMAKLSADVRYCLHDEDTPAAAMTRLNSAVHGEGWEGRFVTMVLAVIDPKTNEIIVANAGHMPPYLRRGKQVLEIGSEESGIPLGVKDGFEYQQIAFTMQHGEFLTLFTDGINEAENPAGEQFGLRGIPTILAEPTPPTADSLGNALLERVRTFTGATDQFDDMCVICFGRTDEGQATS